MMKPLPIVGPICWRARVTLLLWAGGLLLLWTV
jgi:hypothetical protein